MKSVIYARVSTRKQEEAGTIETQLDRIAHDPVVSSRYGEPIDQYLDQGVSGRLKPLWERPQGKRLLADAREHKFDVVIVYKFNRLGRKAADTEQAIEELLSLGVVIYDVRNSLTIENSSAAGKMIRQMMGIAAEFEVNNDIETMRDGLERKARTGKLMPTYARLGFDWSSLIPEGEPKAGHKATGASLVVNKTEAELVNLIYASYGEMSLNRLTKWLNEQGYRLPCKSVRLRKKYDRNERLFTTKAVMKILTDSLYTGMVVWGNTTKVTDVTPMCHRHHFPELQIVDFAVFNRVQQVIAQRRTVPRKSAGSPYIFSGLVRCPHCGGRTVGKRQWHPEYDHKETRRYQCRSHHVSGKTACRGWDAFEQSITKAVVPFLVDLFENKLKLHEYVEAETKNMMQQESEGKVSKVLGQKEAALARLKNVQSMTIDGLMTTEEARPYIFEARETIEKAERQLADVRENIDLRDELLEALSKICEDLQATLIGLDPLAMQALVRQVFKHFTIGKKGKGYSHQTWIESYEFQEEIKDLLASSTFGLHTPALEIV